MKLRLYGDFIRFRLSPSDVAALDQTGRVKGVTHFGPGLQFEYGLEANFQISEIRCRFECTSLVVELPRAMARKWVQSEQVGINHVQSFAGGSLKILIEKDFECLHKEDQEP